jgi:hypothetical protein
MTSSSNEQDLIFKAKFEDDASEDIQSLDKDVEGLDKSMGGLSMSSVTAGLAMFGVGVGAKKVADTVQETTHKAAGLNAEIVLLPKDTQVALGEMEKEFTQIGLDVAGTGLEVKDVAVGIAASSGGIVPKIEDIQAAFALARTKGIDLGAAADIVGLALQGNEEPLNNLLDPSGRSYISYKKVLEDLVPASEEAITVTDRVSAAFKSSIEQLTDLNGLAETFFAGMDGKEMPDWGPDDGAIEDWDEFFNGINEGYKTAIGWALDMIGLGKDDVGRVGIDTTGSGHLSSELQSTKARQDVRDYLGIGDADMTPVTHNGKIGVSGFDQLTSGLITANITINADSDVAGSKISREIANQLLNLQRTGVTN